ncbi:MAG TPA: HNH endonuclease [Leptospiraceae bacterium]|nr:HNH endonuclease [Leptospiraceae bacterium]
MDILSQPVLILNTSYMPVSVKSVRDAICMVLLEKAEVIKAAEDSFIRSEKLRIPVPYIILLANYYHVPRKRTKVSRANILERDEYTCVYCGKKPVQSKLTLDHIVPRSRWENIPKDRKPSEFNSWENVVTACRECNTKKGSKLLSELRWKAPEIKKMDYRLNHIPHINNASAEKYGWNDYLQIFK